MTEMKQFRRANGYYMPGKKFRHREGSENSVGLYFGWEAMWLIEKGRWKGMWAMVPIFGPEGHQFPLAWVPSCHIKFD